MTIILIATTGYARDFTYFLTDADNVLTAEQAEDNTLFVPALFDAKEYGTLTYEFHADTGKYYYTFDLGDTLDQDIILFGGSTALWSKCLISRSLIADFVSITIV